MSILDKIINYKREELEDKKSLFPVKLLEKSIYFSSKPVSLKKYLRREDKSGIIAELKRKSPSRGDINPYISIEKTSIGYMQAGASALSVLTDTRFFGGKNEDLTVARKFNFCPILRKDFIIDEYQVIEAKSIGADAILLIASILSEKEIKKLSELAGSLGLETLLEVHNLKELASNKDQSHIDLVGVNNRDLNSFEVNVNVSKELSDEIPESFIKVSESGINDPQTLIELMDFGFKGFLIGEYFMKHSRPEMACKNFIERLNRLKKQSVRNE